MDQIIFYFICYLCLLRRILTPSLSMQFRYILYRINTIIGIVQEGSAEKAADALKAMMSLNAIVVRDGKEIEVAADQLVPGDIVKLSLGDKVPAGKSSFLSFVFVFWQRIVFVQCN